MFLYFSDFREQGSYFLSILFSVLGHAVDSMAAHQKNSFLPSLQLRDYSVTSLCLCERVCVSFICDSEIVFGKWNKTEMISAALCSAF